MFDEGCGVLEEEGDLHCVRSPARGDRSCLKISAGDLDVLVFQKEFVSDIIDRYTIDGDKDSFRSLTKGMDEIYDILGCGWSGVCVVSGWNLW